VTEFIGYVGIALLLAGLPLPLAQWCGVSRRVFPFVILLLVAMVLIPWNGHPAVFYVRGITGDLSISSLVLLCILYGRVLMWPTGLHQPIRGQVGWVLLAIQVPLTHSVLGYWQYDLYGLGYEPQWLLIGAGLLMLWAWRTQPALAIAWLIGVISFACGMTPSRNLWDALFDLYMGFAAVGIAVTSVIRAIFGRRTAKTTEKEIALRRAA
jgi:hypothetical protein